MPTFSFPTLIHFGPGVRKDVGPHLKAQGVTRPLLVTDKGLAALPLPKELMESVARRRPRARALLGHRGQSRRELRHRGRRRLSRAQGGRDHRPRGRGRPRRGQGHRADGDPPGRAVRLRRRPPGATPIDRGRALLGRAPHHGRHRQRGRSQRGHLGREDARQEDRVLAEAARPRRVRRPGADARPASAKVTAATGMDALTHCIEAFLAKDYHPICDGIALEGCAWPRARCPAASRRPATSRPAAT